MAVKFKYENEADIPAHVKSEYKQVGSAWHLMAEGTDEAIQLKQALEAERLESKSAKDKLKAIAEEKAAAELEAARAKGDVTALEASWKKKYDDDVQAVKDKLAARDKAVRAAARDAAADAIANEISTAPTLLRRYVRDRLSVELVEDNPIVRVLDATGKASALSLDDLKKEVVANKEFAAIIKASSASGGGAGSKADGGKGNGGAGSGAKLISKMTLDERKALHAADPAAFNARVKAEQAALMNT